MEHAHIGLPEFWRLLAASDPRLNTHLWHFIYPCYKAQLVYLLIAEWGCDWE